jgi:hypothetical protein
VGETIAEHVARQFRSAFAEGTFTRVDVLGCGDDSAVGPGQTAVRGYIDRASGPDEDWDSREALDGFARANSDGIEKLRDGLLGSVVWVEFIDGRSDRQAEPYSPGWGSTRLWCTSRPGPGGQSS